jgi:HEAT repeat protein
MWHFRHIRHALTAAAAPCAVLTTLLLTPALPAQTTPRTDPVEELRRELRQPTDPSNNNALDYRQKTLKERLATLKTLSELRRALALTEWQDMPGRPLAIQKIDEDGRQAIAAKFKKGVDAVIKTGDADARLALAEMLAETGAIRGLLRDPRGDPIKTGFGRAMTPELIQLTTDRDPVVRAAAARSLGKVFPEPKAAAEAIKKVLESGSTQERRGAAEGLVNMIQVVSALQKTGQILGIGVEAKGEDVVDAARWILWAAGPGLAYSDPRVRELTLDAVLKSLQAFREQVPEPFDPSKLPPSDRPLTPRERKELKAAHDLVQDEQNSYAPLVAAARKLAEPLAALLNDPAPRVRLEARRVLETVGEARLRMLRRAGSVPALPAEGAAAAPLRPVAQKAAEGKEDPLAAAIEPGLHIIARGLRDPEAKIRLATVEFLETLEDAARPAVPLLVEALADSNRFVRWAAARAFSKIGPDPKRLGIVVPGLASLLRDPDVDVAKQAAMTLGSYGDAAAAAVPALAQTAALADPEVRVASMNALGGFSPAKAAAAVPALIAALTDRDAEVRKTAAETLGKVGPRARDAVPPLRVALRDENANVRRAASDAILSILAPVASK